MSIFYTLELFAAHFLFNVYTQFLCCWMTGLDACKSSEMRYHINFYWIRSLLTVSFHIAYIITFLFCSLIFSSSFLFISFCLFCHRWPSLLLQTLCQLATIGNRTTKWDRWKSALVKKKTNFHLKLAIEYGEQHISSAIPLNPNRNLKIIIIFVKNSKIKILRHSQFCFFSTSSSSYSFCYVHLFINALTCSCCLSLLLPFYLSLFAFIVTVFLSHFCFASSSSSSSFFIKKKYWCACVCLCAHFRLICLASY